MNNQDTVSALLAILKLLGSSERVSSTDTAPATPSSLGRAVVIIDRGWVIAGDQVKEGDNLTLTKAVLVQRWDGVGFDGMLANPKSDKVVLKPLAYDVVVPKGSVIFSVPVPASWGL